jgi:hypothetical protein
MDPTSHATQPFEMIIHDVRVDGDEIVVGATDLQRWQWELQDGRANPSEAKTLVYVSLVNPGPGWAIVETMGLHLSREDPLRAAAIDAIPALLEAAWEILEQRWTRAQAWENVGGRRLGPE